MTCCNPVTDRNSEPTVTSCYINVKPPHLTLCAALTHILWIIISVHFLCTSYCELLYITAQTVQLFHFTLKTDILYIFHIFMHIFIVDFFKFLDCCSTCFFTCFLFLFSYSVYCYSPKHQVRFLVCVNLLGIKPILILI